MTEELPVKFTSTHPSPFKKIEFRKAKFNKLQRSSEKEKFIPPDPEEELEISGGRSADTLHECLTHINVQFRFNIRSGKPEVRDATLHDQGPLEGWKQVNENISAWIRDQIACFTVETKKDDKQVPMRWSDQAFHDRLAALSNEIQVDPFEEYLRWIPRWDGKPRLDAWLTDLFGAGKEPLDKWAARFFFMAPIQRAIQIGNDPSTGPGCKIDQMPVLFGEKGDEGKSSAPREMFPPSAQAQFFCDSFRLDDRQKEQIEALQGRVIVECGEMSGIHGADLAKMKATLTKTTLGGVRMAFARKALDIPRRDVIIGTTDKENCLPNDHNNRRFVVVKLQHGGNVEKFMRANRDLLWAEALQRYLQGERAPLPRSFKPMQEQRNSRYRRTDESYEAAVNSLSQDEFVIAHALKGGVFSLRWLSNRCRIEGHVVSSTMEGDRWEPRWPLSRGVQYRIQDALKNAGWATRNKSRYEDPDGEKQISKPWVAPANIGE